jgi:hypothetical protein
MFILPAPAVGVMPKGLYMPSTATVANRNSAPEWDSRSRQSRGARCECLLAQAAETQNVASFIIAYRRCRSCDRMVSTA